MGNRTVTEISIQMKNTLKIHFEKEDFNGDFVNCEDCALARAVKRALRQKSIDFKSIAVGGPFAGIGTEIVITRTKDLLKKEIIKETYTEKSRKVKEVLVECLPRAHFNEAFGGDPRYRVRRRVAIECQDKIIKLGNLLLRTKKPEKTPLYKRSLSLLFNMKERK